MATPKNKLQKMLASSKRAKQKRISKALRHFLKQVNPAGKMEGAKMRRNRGGSITIIPLKSLGK